MTEIQEADCGLPFVFSVMIIRNVCVDDLFQRFVFFIASCVQDAVENIECKGEAFLGIEGCDVV